MAMLTWIGGGNNQASNPKDWVDQTGSHVAPKAGDALYVNGSGRRR